MHNTHINVVVKETWVLVGGSGKWLEVGSVSVVVTYKHCGMYAKPVSKVIFT